MQRGFGGTAFEPLEAERRDREVTLGPLGLAALALGLFALCCACFLGGYAVGHRSSPAAVSQAPAASPSAAQLLSQSKPPAAPASAQTPSGDASPADTGTENPPVDADASTTPASPGGVQSALPAQAASTQPAAVTNQTVQPALAQGTQWMVQIAAVSQSEDADVLVSALRKRGYAVSTRHDPVDELIHVQVGPFTSHNDALAAREKLLNDGYNAIIEP